MAYTIDQLVGFYIQTRDKEAEIKARYDAELKPVHQLMAQLESVFMAHMQQHGMQSFATPHGTPYLSTHTNVRVVDWETFFNFALANGQTGLLTHGANKKSVEQFLEATKAPPPGLEISRATVCNVRRG